MTVPSLLRVLPQEGVLTIQRDCVLERSIPVKRFFRIREVSFESLSREESAAIFLSN